MLPGRSISATPKTVSLHFQFDADRAPRDFAPLMTRFPLPHILAISLIALVALPRNLAAHTPGAEMADAANALLRSLDDGQRARAAFELKDEERLNFHFIPRERRGLPWKDMNAAQRHLATALLASGLSQRGLIKAATIMSLEQILLELEQGRGPARDPEGYFWSLFGKPTPDGTWGWRVEGHHLSINFTIVKGRDIATTPMFFGSNPGEVRQGARSGLRALGAEEDLGRELVRSLNAEQQRQAIIAEKAPNDIFTAAQRKVSPLEPAGLAASAMNDEQKALLNRVIEEYVRRARPELADADLARIKAAGADKLHFAWAGTDEPGQGHYYRVQGPTFLLEYDNTQNNANHVHSVWRSFEGDFGEDILARHYRETPH